MFISSAHPGDDDMRILHPAIQVRMYRNLIAHIDDELERTAEIDDGDEGVEELLRLRSTVSEKIRAL